MKTAEEDPDLLLLLQKHGPLMSGKALWQALGFRNAASFRQSKVRGQLSVRVFSIPNRRGTFAFTKEIAAWLKSLEQEKKM